MNPQPAVIVVGSVNMDLVFTGLAALPQPGETVPASAYRTLPGGKGANQASAAAGLGADVHLVACVGDDDLGDAALADLAARGVGLGHVGRTEGATGVAGVLIDRSGENVVIVAPGANAALGPDSVAAADPFTGREVVVVACLEVPIETVLAWARVAREHGWTFILNPAPARELPNELLDLTDIVTPNATELASLATAADLVARGIRAVVVTRGGEGVDVTTADGTEHVPPFAVDVVDTTGAGDAFNGALAAALAEGQELRDAVAFAAAAGALATRRVGARDALPSREEVLALRSA